MEINSLKTQADILKKVYPVGAIYLSVTSTNPGTLFGGTWTQLKDRFLLGVGNTYKTVNATGGEATHTLIEKEMPVHSHNIGFGMGNNCAGSPGAMGTESKAVSTGVSGGGQAHNNMPPYLTVYMWKRTA